MHRWHWLPISFVTAGVLSMWGVAIVHAGALGWWQVLIYLGGIVALTAAFWFRRELSATEIELEGLRNDLAAEQARLDKRERALDERFRTYHEWMEFPQPIDLKEPSPAAGQDSPGEMIPRDRDLSDDQLQELAAQDRQLMELLQAQTSDRFVNLMEYQAARAERYYDEALALLHPKTGAPNALAWSWPRFTAPRSMRFALMASKS